MIKKIEGLIAASLTGFKEDGSINPQIIPAYARLLHANGVAGVFVNGTSGEGQSLTIKERLSLARHWVESAPKEMLVIIHVGYASQEQSRILAAHASTIRAHAIGEIGPLTNSPKTVRELVDYAAGTASAAPDLPYYYYHMPSVNGLNFPIYDFLQLADGVIPNLAGIKYTHDNIEDYKRCLDYKNGKYDILFGRDEFLMDGLQVGARGAVGSTYNLMAPLYYHLLHEYRAGDIARARQLQSLSAKTCKILYETGSFFCAMKTLMSKIGLDLGGERKRGKSLSHEKIALMEAALDNIGVFEFFNKKE